MGNKFIDPQKKQKGKRGKGGGRFRAFNCYISYLDIRPKPLSTTSQVFFSFPPPKGPSSFLRLTDQKGKARNNSKTPFFCHAAQSPQIKNPGLHQKMLKPRIVPPSLSPVPFSQVFSPFTLIRVPVQKEKEKTSLWFFFFLSSRWWCGLVVRASKVAEVPIDQLAANLGF